MLPHLLKNQYKPSCRIKTDKMRSDFVFIGSNARRRITHTPPRNGRLPKNSKAALIAHLLKAGKKC